MTSVVLYNQIKEALVRQRQVIASSPQTASKLVEDLGIGDLYIESKKVKVAPKKIAARKIAS
ncbi:hypothetical protein [Chitinophaga sp. CF418]|uniref:hypothetical protein n=1 Tax=Chitinophaga sp. CF418 TaxID=1855287 RepID=UPI0009217F0E|nr:hypothetical protein [Chitinophaga sp. CF418]SHM94254.1 hypothetical protein SAMN05216311_10449 [Chitinophaga sp. CF418]